MFEKVRNNVAGLIRGVVGSVAEKERVSRRVIAAYGLTILSLAMGLAISLFIDAPRIVEAGWFRALVGLFLVLVHVAGAVAVYARMTQRSPVKTMHMKGVLVILFLLVFVPADIASIPGASPVVLVYLAYPLALVAPWVLGAAIGYLLVNLYRYARLAPPLVSITSRPPGAVGKWLLAAVPVACVLGVLSLYLVVVGVGTDTGHLVARSLLVLAWLPVVWRLVTCDGMAHCVQAFDRGVLLFWGKALFSVWMLSLVIPLGLGALGDMGVLLLLVLALTVYPMVLIGFVKLYKASVRVLFKGQSFFAGVADSGGSG